MVRRPSSDMHPLAWWVARLRLPVVQAAERAAPQPTAELLEAKSKLVVQEQELQRLRVEAREAQGQVRLSEEERLKLMQQVCSQRRLPPDRCSDVRSFPTVLLCLSWQIQQLESTRSEVAGHKPGDMNEAAEGDAEIKRLRYELNEAISEREEANDGRYGGVPRPRRSNNS
eukprot:scaffold3158_cov389-Prasinococcus_capsulatus_cf.AAC.13